MRFQSVLTLIGFFTASLAVAQDHPFEQCPSSAYLIQGSSARMYGVNLSTGSYQLLSEDLGTTGKINGIGFNVFDRQIYGYSNEWQSLIQINSRFEAMPLSVSNKPPTSFYVGDVALSENTYFAYRPGASYGLYSVSLDPESAEYLVFNKIRSGDDLNIAIFDFAFHPSNGNLYSVDRSGVLISIDPNDGTFEKITNVGQGGTFGAVYFDSSEYFYISRNSDGHIFRINLNSPSPEAEFFAFGPSSSNNDGARCAVANIVSDTDSIDFGNAPSSYGNNIETNGARHEKSDTLFLGSTWGGEDDGIEIVTSVEPGLSTIIVAEVFGDGVLNAWSDWDQNGSFEDTEQTIRNQLLNDGENLIQFEVPDNALPGETWTRVRYSTQTDIGPNGGVSNGEVEDFIVNVVDEGTSVVHYPSSSSYVTLAYEDNWPVVGDYDMNDVVVAFRSSRYSNENAETIRYEINGKVLALGAGYHNGFAVQLDNIPTSEIDLEATRLYLNGAESIEGPLEVNEGEADAVFIISEDLKVALPVTGQCQYYRTEIGCEGFESNEELAFSLIVTLKIPVSGSDSPQNILNPFIFASPGIYHGNSFITPPGRALEIHLKNQKVSSRFDSSVFGTEDDKSNESSTFLTESGMPWALEIPGIWSHPREKQDLLSAYPGFKLFVESSASESRTWFSSENTVEKFVINNRVEK